MNDMPERLSVVRADKTKGCFLAALEIINGTEYVRADLFGNYISAQQDERIKSVEMLAKLRTEQRDDARHLVEKFQERIKSLELSLNVRTAQRDKAEHELELLFQKTGYKPEHPLDTNLHDAFCTCAACVTPERLAADAAAEERVNVVAAIERAARTVAAAVLMTGENAGEAQSFANMLWQESGE